MLRNGIRNAAVVMPMPKRLEPSGMPSRARSGISGIGENARRWTRPGRGDGQTSPAHRRKIHARRPQQPSRGGARILVRHGSVRGRANRWRITVLLTSRKTPPFDLGQLRSQGMEPESFSVIGVKAAVAHRRAYDRIASASYTVRTPGPCTSDLHALPYRRLRRPIFPLDSI